MILKMPKISVIIPVYNAEKYLERCLESVCNQTLRDIEVICVNDCSTDCSEQILQRYSQNYQFLTVVNLPKNQGESGARNCGLTLAKGEYLAFVDNDDEIDLNFYEKLYDKAKETDAEIVKGQAIEVAYNGNQHLIKQMREDDNKLLFITYWWTAIYKRSLIVGNNIFFSTQHILGGDMLFLNRAIIAAKNLQLVDGVFYHYYRREDSGDAKILSEEKMRSALNIHELIADNINASLLPSDPIYGFIFHHFIIGCFYLSFKSADEKLKEFCAQAALNIFVKCRDNQSLQSYFAKTVPQLFVFLKNRDQQALAQALVKYKSRAELIAAGLRARINK